VEIRKTYVIEATPERVWLALTDPDAMEEWGSGPALMEPEPGGLFSQWGGSIHGVVTEVIDGERLVESWYGGDWPAPSTVVFTLASQGEGTAVDLLHTGVPDEEVGDIDSGWDEFYLGAIKVWAQEA
jgi:uncharacterized protein YndB with AHSA1/START domain